MTKGIQEYLINGCMRCKLGATAACKVNNWRNELIELIHIAKESGLNAESKWGVPCFTYNNRNVLVISALKEKVIISFFKGSLMSDPKNKLISPGPNSQAARYLQFQTLEEIESQRDLIGSYIKESIFIEESGKKVQFSSEIPALPKELEEIMENDPVLANAFYALTPGRQRGYVIYFSQPKGEEARKRRIENSISKIMSGKGLNDHYKK